MADDLAALIEAVSSARMETTTALGRLTPRNARRINEPLCAEREATNRLVLMTDERLVRVTAVVRKQTETIASANQTIISLERQLGGMESWDRGQVELIRLLFGLLDAHGIAHPPLPPCLKAEVMH